MAKFSFGEAPQEDDILVIQGEEYRLRPFGMQAFRDSLERSKQVEGIRQMSGPDRTESTYKVSVELILAAVVDEDRERLAEHIDRSVGPGLVSTIAAAIMRGLTDVDPTQQTSSSDGSPETGHDSTDGVSDEESTPES